MTKRTTRRSKSTPSRKATRAKAAKPRSAAKRRAPAKASAKPARRGRTAAKATAKPARRGSSGKASATPARRGRTAAARAQTRTVVAPKLSPKRPGTARASRGAQGSGEEPTRALLALDPEATRFGESEASFHLEDSSEGADGLREELGESYVENATGVDDAAMAHRQDTTEDEVGGPFVVTSARTEFADGVDESNPADAEREPLPTV